MKGKQSNIRDELLQKSRLSCDLQQQYEQNEMRKNSLLVTFHEPDAMSNLQLTAVSPNSKNTDGEAVISIMSPTPHFGLHFYRSTISVTV
jgi:hypothetical protein